MPEHGIGSVARPGRRILALAIDGALTVLPSMAFFEYDRWANLIIFAVLQIAFIPTIGGSIGHRIAGLRLVPLDGGWVGVWRPVVRTALLMVVLPALVWDSDQRGFHDKVAKTVLRRS